MRLKIIICITTINSQISKIPRALQEALNTKSKFSRNVLAQILNRKILNIYIQILFSIAKIDLKFTHFTLYRLWTDLDF